MTDEQTAQMARIEGHARAVLALIGEVKRAQGSVVYARIQRQANALPALDAEVAANQAAAIHLIRLLGNACRDIDLVTGSTTAPEPDRV